MTTFSHGNPVTGTFVTQASGVARVVVVETSPGQFVHLPDTATVTPLVKKENTQ